MMKRLIPLLLSLALLLLTACAPPAGEGGVTYELGGNGPEGSVIIHAYDADYIEYTSSSMFPGGGFLYFANPRSLHPVFADAATEGTAHLEDGRIRVDFARGDDPDGGTVQGPGADFTVELSSQAILSSNFVACEGTTLSLTDREMGEIGLALAELIDGAVAYLQAQPSPAPSGG